MSAVEEAQVERKKETDEVSKDQISALGWTARAPALSCHRK